jgi:hypothetical protein
MHPYAAACALAGLAVIGGILIVERSTTAKPGELTVWGSGGAPLLNPSSYAPDISAPVADMRGGTNLDPTYIPPSKEVEAESDDTFQLSEILKSLSRPGTVSTSTVTAEAEAGINTVRLQTSYQRTAGAL